MTSKRPAVLETASASVGGAAAAAKPPPSTPSPVNRNKRSNDNKKKRHVDDADVIDRQQQQPALSTPTSMKRRSDSTQHGSASSKRSRRSAAVSFSPHLSIVHEFESNSPSKRRLDYRSGSAAVLDDDQVRMELDVQGHKLPPTERINAFHRALVEQMHARGLLEELTRAGLEPQPKQRKPVVASAGVPASASESRCKAHDKDKANVHVDVAAGFTVPVLASVADFNRTVSGARSVSSVAGRSKVERTTSNNMQTRKSKHNQPPTSAKENSTLLHSLSSTTVPSSSTTSNSNSKDTSIESEADVITDDMKHSIEGLRTRVKCARWIIRRAHLRLAFGADTPVNMAERRLEQELERRKICVHRNYAKLGEEDGVSSTVRERGVAALEMAMEHEQAGLVGMGYDFGKRHVSIDELCEMEGPSTEKELRLFLVAHKVKTVPRSRKARVALYRELLEQELSNRLDRALGLELVDELHRRRLEKPGLHKPFSKSKMQRHLNRMMLDMLLGNMANSLSNAKTIASTKVVQQ